jgi:plasmid stabilization system protein ParE
MRELIWSDAAITNLVRLRKFISEGNPNAAKKAAEAINDAAQRLIETPLIGKPVKDLIDYRDLLTRFGAGGYVIRYRIFSDSIYVVNVRHYREFNFK